MLDPKHHSVVVVKEKNNPNVNSCGSVNKTNNLGFKKLVSPSSHPNFLNEKMPKGWCLNFEGNSAGVSSVKEGTVSLEQAIDCIVHNLDEVNKNMGVQLGVSNNLIMKGPPMIRI